MHGTILGICGKLYGGIAALQVIGHKVDWVGHQTFIPPNEHSQLEQLGIELTVGFDTSTIRFLFPDMVYYWQCGMARGQSGLVEYGWFAIFPYISGPAMVIGKPY